MIDFTRIKEMKIEHYHKTPEFVFDDYTISYELSKEARLLYKHLQHLYGDNRYNYIAKGFIPLDYTELSTELGYSNSLVHKCFNELEELGFVNRCIARFVQIKRREPEISGSNGGKK